MILIDGNNIGFAATAGKPLHAGTMQTQGVFGLIRRIAEIRREFDGKMVVLWDGKSWRYDHYPDYKANRRVAIIEQTGEESDDQEPAQEAPGVSKSLAAQIALGDQWKAQRPFAMGMLSTLGVPQMLSRNMEADDLAARITAQRPGEDHVLVTGDKDWLQLVDQHTTWYNPIDYQTHAPKIRRVTPHNFREATGFANPWLFTQAKALMGDAGDNIKGVGGIGLKGAQWILETFGGVEAFYNESLTCDSTKWAKKYRDLADSPEKFDQYLFNMFMVWLKHPSAPAMIKLNMTTTKQDPDAFLDLCGQLAFHSLINRQSELLSLFQPKSLETV